MTPAEQLGQILADARRAGDPFETAWPAALSAAVSGQATPDRAAWLAALQATRVAWRAAWERRPPTRAQCALAAVADDEERVPLEPADNGTYCQRCDAPILAAPRQRGPRAIYCGGPCRRAASVARLAA
jgi:hypothetical protein